jgi:hypothetical protein
MSQSRHGESGESIGFFLSTRETTYCAGGWFLMCVGGRDERREATDVDGCAELPGALGAFSRKRLVRFDWLISGVGQQ